MEPTDSEDATAVRSLGLAAIAEVVDQAAFPVTTEALIEEYGDREVEYPHGSETIASILRTSGMETYETADEIELAILNGVRRDAVGRPRYSDRSDERDVELDRPHLSL